MKSHSSLYAALPHGPSFHCIRKILQVSEDEFHGQIVFDTGSVFESVKGNVPTCSIIEVIAQLAALGLTVKHNDDARREGVIVKVNRFSANSEFLAIDTIYTAIVHVNDAMMGVLDVQGVFMEKEGICGEVSMMILQQGVSR